MVLVLISCQGGTLETDVTVELLTSTLCHLAGSSAFLTCWNKLVWQFTTTQSNKSSYIYCFVCHGPLLRYLISFEDSLTANEHIPETMVFFPLNGVHKWLWNDDLSCGFVIHHYLNYGFIDDQVRFLTSSAFTKKHTRFPLTLNFVTWNEREWKRLHVFLFAPFS